MHFFNAYIFTLLILCSCSSKNDTITDYDSYVDSQSAINRQYEYHLRDLALKGDSLAYAKLASQCQLHFYCLPELLFTSYEVVELGIIKGGYPYYNIYIAMNDGNSHTLKKTSLELKHLSLYYLFKSYEMGYEQAKKDFPNEYKDNIPSSSFFLQKMIEHNN